VILLQIVVDGRSRPVHTRDHREDPILADQLLDATLCAGDLTRAVVAVGDRHPPTQHTAAVIDRGHRGAIGPDLRSGDDIAQRHTGFDPVVAPAVAAAVAATTDPRARSAHR
jgi:hypothetical protein